MDPGFELDALVAEKVFGCEVKFHYFGEATGVSGEKISADCNCPGLEHTDSSGFRDIKEYSADISAAWEVVEKIKNGKPFEKDGFRDIRISYESANNKWLVEWLHEDFWPTMPYGETAPHAILSSSFESGGKMNSLYLKVFPLMLFYMVLVVLGSKIISTHFQTEAMMYWPLVFTWNTFLCIGFTYSLFKD